MDASDMDDLKDKYACAELIQAWGLYRDQGKWPELLATFTADGQIAVSWFSGGFPEFVERCRQAFETGQRSKHHIFPSVVRLAGGRALAETNIVILGFAVPGGGYPGEAKSADKPGCADRPRVGRRETSQDFEHAQGPLADRTGQQNEAARDTPEVSAERMRSLSGGIGDP